MRGGDHRFDPAAKIEVPDDLHPLRLHCHYQVVENPVHGSLVKNPVVPEAPQVELQALELDADFGWYIRDPDDPEIRSSTGEQRELLRITLYAAKRTERCELVAVHVDFVIAICVGIREGLNQLGTGHPEECTIGDADSISAARILPAFATFPLEPRVLPP